MISIARSPRFLFRKSYLIQGSRIKQSRAIHLIGNLAALQNSKNDAKHGNGARITGHGSTDAMEEQEIFESAQTASTETKASPLAELYADSTRLGKPEAFDAPEYSGNVLPFPDKANYKPPEPVVSNARHNSTPTLDSSANTHNFRIKKIFDSKPDPFLQIVRGTGQITPTVYEDVDSLREYRREVAQRGHSVGFVPTMGALHEGHLDLMRAAAARCSEVWVSIYVNPTQFGANEDLSTYPSTWEADLAKIEKLNDRLLSDGHGRVSTIFKPGSVETLYPYGIDGTSHVIINPELTQILEGSSRPTFFRGVTTVVMKLLNIVQPERVYFGQKDIQQFAVIKRMIKEFHLPVQIERVPTRREYSGLAMSSRNAYLGERRFRAASVLFRMLSEAKETFNSLPAQQKTRKLLLDTAMKVYNAEKDFHEKRALSKPSAGVQFKLDYLSLADPDTLREIPDVVGPQGAIMSLAVYFQPLKKEHISSQERLGINGDQTVVRLIDNELLGVDQEIGTNNQQGLQDGLRI